MSKTQLSPHQYSTNIVGRISNQAFCEHEFASRNELVPQKSIFLFHNLNPLASFRWSIVMMILMMGIGGYSKVMAQCITTYQPASLNVNGCDGGNSVFRINYMSGLASEPTIVWEYNDGGGWDPLSGSPVMHTITNNFASAFTRLTVNSTALSYNGYQFRALFSGSCTETSDEFTLSVKSPVSITSQPSSAEACATETGPEMFSAATSAIPTSYLWQSSPTGAAPWATIAGSNNATLSVANPSVTWPVPSDVEDSKTIYLRMRAAVTGCPNVFTDIVEFRVDKAPTITAISDDVTICTSGETDLSVTLGGSADEVTWTGTGTFSAPTDNPVTYSNVTAGTYTITATSNVNGECAAATETVDVTVEELSIDGYSPVSKVATRCVGQNQTFGITASSSATISYQWQVDTGSGYMDIVGEESASLTLTAVTSGMNGNMYQCVVSTEGCSVTSDPFTLNVDGPIAITTQPVSITDICITQEEATFSVVATTEEGTLTYQWQSSLDGLGSWTNISGAQLDSYTIDNSDGLWPVALGGSVFFRCLVDVGACTAVPSDVAELGISSDGPVTVDAGVDQFICKDGTATLSGLVSPSDVGSWSSSDGGIFSDANAPGINSPSTFTPPVGFAGDITLTLTSYDPDGDCPVVTDDVVITVVGVDVDGDLASCFADGAVDIEAVVSGTGDTDGTWTTSGAGSFGDDAETSTTYTPDAVDQVVTLTYTHTASTCSDELVLTVNKITLTSSSKARTVCEGSPLPSGTPFRQNRDTNPNSNGSTDTWEYSVDGNAPWNPVASLPMAATTMPTVTGTNSRTDLYFAGPVPYSYNGYNFRVTITEGECTETVDGFVLTVIQAPVAIAGADMTMCYDGVDITLVAGAGSTLGSWSVSLNAEGTLSGNTYTPSEDDKGLTLTFTYTADGVGVCADAMDSKDITFDHITEVSHVPGAGANYTRIICETTGTTNFQYNYTSAPLAADPTGSVTWEYRESDAGTWADASSAPIFNNVTSNTRINLQNITIDHNGYQFRATVVAGECSVTSQVFTLVVRPLGVVTAGDDASVCIVGNTVSLNGNISGEGYSILNWISSDATGIFDDATSLTAVYTPGSDPVATLTLTSNNPDGGQGCPAVSDDMTVTVEAYTGSIYAGLDATICAGSTYTTVGTIGGNVLNANWTTTGDGSFDIPGGISGAEYTPGSADIAAGYVDLVLTSDHAVGDCDDAQDSVRVTIASFGFTTYMPESKEVNTCDGEEVSLEVSFTSVTTPTVAWEMFDGTDWVAAIGTVTTTATTTTLEFEADAVAHDGKTFRVTLDASGCTQVISDEFTVNVNGKLEIVTNPIDDLDNCSNLLEAEFTASASTDVGEISYQWQYSDDGGTMWHDINDATDASVTIPNSVSFWPGLGESIQVKMIVSVPYCSDVETSTATLSISADPAADIEAGDPTMTICQGDMVSLNGMIITANTSAIWSTSGDGLFANGMTSTSVMNTTYSPGASDISNGMVTLTLTGNDPLGTCDPDMDNIIVTIGNGSVGTTAPANGLLTRCEGSDAVFRVNFSSPVIPSPQIPTIVWQREGVDIVDDAKYDILDGGSATQSRLRVNDVTDADAVTYTVIVTYPGCDPETRDFTLTVVDGPTADAGTYAPICADGTIALEGMLGGSATQGTWSSATGGVFSDVDIDAASATYTPSAADIAAGSVILTLTSNGAVPGCPVVPVDVTVDIHSITPAAISLTSPQCDGEVLSITSTWTKGTTTPVAETATWEVSTDGGATYLPFAGTSVVNTAGQSVLTFTAVSGAYMYRARIVSGACDVTTNAVSLTVNGPVVFDTHPTSVLNVCQSTTEMEFTASATNSGTGTITYRWQYSNNGTTGWTNVATSVDGYNTTTLTVDDGDGVAWPVIGNVSGKYYRLVANLAGCSNLYTSDAAQFIISNDAEPMVIVPADAFACKGDIVNLTGAISGSATSATWTKSGGTGAISNPPGDYANATYTPGTNDTGEVTFTLTSNDPAGVCPPAVESFIVTYIDVNAGTDINVCIDGSELDPITLAGMVTGMELAPVTWSDNGAGGSFDDPTLLTAAYTPASSTSPVTLTLTSNGCSDNVMVIFNENITNVALSGAAVKNVCVGSGTSFRVNFDPATGVTRTWQYSANGTNWADLVIAAPFSVTSPGTSDTQLNLLSSGSNTGASLDMQGFYRVVLTNGECMIESDPFTLNVSEITSASLNSGDDLAICQTATDVTVTGVAASSGSGTAMYRLRYSINGGAFVNLGALSATPSFTFSSGAAWDAALHSSGMTVELRMRVTHGGCTFDSDPIGFTREEAPTVTAGSDDIICETGTATLAGTMGGSASSITWSSNKAGSFDDATSLTAVYTPGEPGMHTLTITSDGPIGSCAAATATVMIDVEDQVIVNAGDDQAVCQSEGTMDVILNGSTTPSDASVTWTASSGSFDDMNVLEATYTPDGSSEQVTLTLTPTQVVCTAIPDEVVISLGNGITLNSFTPGGGSAGTRTVCNGGNTSFSVSYDATILATHQWRIKDGAADWIDLPVDATSYGIGAWTVVSDDNSVTLSLTGLTVDANGLLFQVVVTDRGCSVEFGDFTLNVNGPVSFSTLPADLTVCSTATMATFSGAAVNSGAGGSPSYQWQYFNGSIWVNVPNTVAGYNGTSLFLTNAATGIWPAAGSSVDLRLNATIPVCGITSSEPATLSRTNTPCDAIADLLPTIPRPLNTSFSPGQTKEGFVQVSNTGTGNTTGTITFTVSKVANFTLNIPSGMTMSASTPVNNADWTITQGNFVWIITAPANSIAPGANSKVGYTLTRIGNSGSSGTMTVNIVTGSGGETNGGNNITTKSFSNL